MFSFVLNIFFILQSCLVLFSLTTWDWVQRLPFVSYFTSIPLYWSASFFTLILIGLFLCYFYFLKNAKKISRRFLWKIILATAAINLLCYPAYLSHDIFSYLGFAKVTINYHQNPYFAPASNFPTDSLLPFNHWPTSPSRYGPTWLIPIILAYLISGQNIILSAYLLKLFVIIAGFLLSAYLIEKVSKKSLLFFALNPFIFIEMAGSIHSDSLMVALALLSLYLLMKKQKIGSFLVMAGSFVTKIVSLPMALVTFMPKKYKKHYPLLFFLISWIGTAAIIFVWSINPWYLLLPITFGSIFCENKTIRWFLISLSAAALVRYLPFFYWSYFDPNNKIRLFLFLLTLVPYCLWFLFTIQKRIKDLKALTS